MSAGVRQLVKNLEEFFENEPLTANHYISQEGGDQVLVDFYAVRGFTKDIVDKFKDLVETQGYNVKIVTERDDNWIDVPIYLVNYVVDPEYGAEESWLKAARNFKPSGMFEKQAYPLLHTSKKLYVVDDAVVDQDEMNHLIKAGLVSEKEALEHLAVGGIVVSFLSEEDADAMPVVYKDNGYKLVMYDRDVEERQFDLDRVEARIMP